MIDWHKLAFLGFQHNLDGIIRVKRERRKRVDGGGWRCSEGRKVVSLARDESSRKPLPFWGFPATTVILICIIYRASPYRAVNTLRLGYIEGSELMMYREIMAVCSEIHTKHINTVCGQNVEFLKVLGGIYSDHWTSNCWTFKGLSTDSLCRWPQGLSRHKHW